MKAFDFFQCRGRTENTVSTDLSFGNIFCLELLPFKSLLPDPPGVSLSCHPFSEQLKKKNPCSSVCGGFIYLEASQTDHQKAGGKKKILVLNDK